MEIPGLLAAIGALAGWQNLLSCFNFESSACGIIWRAANHGGLYVGKLECWQSNSFGPVFGLPANIGAVVLPPATTTAPATIWCSSLIGVLSYNND